MRFSQRFFCLLLCFALLSTVFSLSVSAKENILKDHTYSLYRMITNDEYNRECSFSFYPPDDAYGSYNNVIYSDGVPYGSDRVKIDDTLRIYPANDEVILFSKGESTTVSIFNIYCDVLISNSTNGSRYYRQVDNKKILVIYKDGSSQYLTDNISLNLHGGYYDCEFTFEPKKDVKSIEVITSRVISISPVSEDSEVKLFGGKGTELTNSKVEQSSEESGLLRGVIDWLKGIKNGISDLFSSITDGFTNLIQKIIELPQTLWQLISDGLKSLFVPDSEYISEFKTNFDNLLKDRFGILYQSGTIILDTIEEMANQMSSGEIQNYLEFPEAELSFGNTVFSFGGWNVKIVPEGFEFLIELIRLFTTGLLFFPFINACRKRYDRLVGDNS